MENDAKKNVVEIPVSSIGPKSGVEDVNNKGNSFHAPKPTGALAPKGTTVPADTKNSDEKKPVEAPFHEHPRFKELITQKNTLSTEVQTLKQQLAQLTAKPSPTPSDVSKVSNIVKRLVETSTMDETNAKAFVDDILSEVESRTKQKISPLEEDYNVRVEQQTRIRTADENWSKFKETTKESGEELDAETEKKMQALFMKLNPEERQQVSLDKTHFGLKMLYRMAKDGTGAVPEVMTPGTPPVVTAPAPNRTGSVAGKTTGTPATGFKFKLSELNAMPNHIFRSREAEIKAAQAAGQIDLSS